MTTYRVTYEIDVVADSHELAALEAYDTLRDVESQAPIFDVEQWPDEATSPPHTCDRTDVVCVDCEEVVRRELA